MRRSQRNRKRKVLENGFVSTFVEAGEVAAEETHVSKESDEEFSMMDEIQNSSDYIIRDDFFPRRISNPKKRAKPMRRSPKKIETLLRIGKGRGKTVLKLTEEENCLKKAYCVLEKTKSTKRMNSPRFFQGLSLTKKDAVKIFKTPKKISPRKTTTKKKRGDKSEIWK